MTVLLLLIYLLLVGLIVALGWVSWTLLKRLLQANEQIQSIAQGQFREATEYTRAAAERTPIQLTKMLSAVQNATTRQMDSMMEAVKVAWQPAKDEDGPNSAAAPSPYSMPVPFYADEANNNDTTDPLDGLLPPVQGHYSAVMVNGGDMGGSADDDLTAMGIAPKPVEVK